MALGLYKLLSNLGLPRPVYVNRHVAQRFDPSVWIDPSLRRQGRRRPYQKSKWATGADPMQLKLRQGLQVDFGQRFESI